MEKKKLNESDFQGSVDAKIQYSVFQDGQLSRDTIKGWLSKDIRGVYLLLSELLTSPEALDALTEVFYKRYLSFHEQKAKATDNVQ